MPQAVFCIVNTPQAASIVERLAVAGFIRTDISVLVPEAGATKDFAVNNTTKVPEGIAAGAGTGAVVGGGLGWLAGIGALAIPGLGPLIAAGPIVAALSCAAVGGTVGGLTGVLIGMGIPEFEATRYEGKMKGGNSLIAVHAENAAEAERAKAIFEFYGGRDISISSEPAAAGGA